MQWWTLPSWHAFGIFSLLWDQRWKMELARICQQYSKGSQKSTPFLIWTLKDWCSLHWTYQCQMMPCYAQSSGVYPLSTHINISKAFKCIQKLHHPQPTFNQPFLYALIYFKCSNLQTSKYQPMFQMCINAPSTWNIPIIPPITKSLKIHSLTNKQLTFKLQNFHEWAHSLLKHNKTREQIALTKYTYTKCI